MQPLQRNLVRQRFSTRRYETIDAILRASRENVNLQVDDMGRFGKLRRVKVTRYFSDCDPIADNCNQNFCNPGEVQEPQQEMFDITRCISTKVKTLRKEDLRSVDGDWTFSDHAMEQIRSGADMAHRELARRIDALLLANAGVHLDGNATHRVTMTNVATGQIQPVGMWDIQQEFADGGFTAQPYMIGSKEVFQWKKAIGIATENNTTGQDYSKIGLEGLYYDTVLNEVAGDTANGEHIIAYDPNSLKFVSWNKNAGIFATDLRSIESFNYLYQGGNESFIRGVIRDEYGLLWDLNIRYNECEEEGWNWYLELNWDIFFPRVQPCNAPGVNGIFHYRTCPVVLAPCPTGDPVPAPATLNTYQNTPGAIFPFRLYSLSVLGTTNSYPEGVQVDDINYLAAILNDGSEGGFYVVGSNLRLKGYSGTTAVINNGETNLVFAIPSPPVS